MAYIINVSKTRLECEGGSGRVRSSAFLDLKTDPATDLQRIFDFPDEDSLAKVQKDLRALNDFQLLAWAGAAIYADARQTRIVRSK